MNPVKFCLLVGALVISLANRRLRCNTAFIFTTTHCLNNGLKNDLACVLFSTVPSSQIMSYASKCTVLIISTVRIFKILPLSSLGPDTCICFPAPTLTLSAYAVWRCNLMFKHLMIILVSRKPLGIWQISYKTWFFFPSGCIWFFPPVVLSPLYLSFSVCDISKLFFSSFANRVHLCFGKFRHKSSKGSTTGSCQCFFFLH